MNARILLDAVDATYGGLTSLSAEMTTVTETGDTDSFQRLEQRVEVLYQAPDKLRIEQGGRRGMIMVSDGVHLHHYIRRPNRYCKSLRGIREMLPGAFRPEFPGIGGPLFLFIRIAERVVEAEILREESAHTVVRVEYQPPDHVGWTVSTSPLTFWVDRRRLLIVRAEGEAVHRMPPDEETATSKSSIVFTRLDVDVPIPRETFEYTPPPDAVDASDPQGRGGGFIGSRGGVGGSFRTTDKGHLVESSHSQHCSGGTLIQSSKVKFDGVDPTFERRLKISEDRESLRITERIVGPKGPSEREVSIPVV